MKFRIEISRPIVQRKNEGIREPQIADEDPFMPLGAKPMVKLFLQAIGEVGDDGDGLAGLLGKSFEQEFLAVLGDVEEG